MEGSFVVYSSVCLLIIFFLSAVDLNISGTKAVKMISATITVYGMIFLRLSFLIKKK